MIDHVARRQSRMTAVRVEKLAHLIRRQDEQILSLTAKYEAAMELWRNPLGR